MTPVLPIALVSLLVGYLVGYIIGQYDGRHLAEREQRTPKGVVHYTPYNPED